MRVIAGRWRGRRLQAPPGQAVRPTTDRVKEAVFNILGPQVRGAVVLDLCCGAGGLGIEALSRGADRSLLIDTAAASLRAARANLERCGATAGSFEVIRADVKPWLERWLQQANPPENWLLLADPPYHSGVAQVIMSTLLAAPVVSGLGVAIVEHGPEDDLSSAAAGSWSSEVRRYGETRLWVWRPSAEP